jgi:hypothetical protein
LRSKWLENELLLSVAILASEQRHKRPEFDANAGRGKQRASNKSAGQNGIHRTGLKLFYVEQFGFSPDIALRLKQLSGIVGLP